MYEHVSYFGLAMGIIVSLTGVAVYLDATDKKIGRIPGSRSIFNMSAGAWATVSLGLWLPCALLYLYKRPALIRAAAESPVTVKRRAVKVTILAIVGLLMLALTVFVPATQIAAMAGAPGAQVNLATFYDSGSGVPKDPIRSSYWYEQAAKNGHVEAQYEIGRRYAMNDAGVARDDAASVRWLRQAALQGFAPAQTLLGAMYADGRGVEQDLEMAFAWLTRASKHGDDHGREARKMIESRLNPDQIAKAKALAEQPTLDTEHPR